MAIQVTGYHGTNRARADRILMQGFDLSTNSYDWLGDGVYFFQDALERAWDWASERFEEPAVVGAEIMLVNCMDLLDIQWTKVLADAHNEYIRQIKEVGIQVPRQKGGGHRLDREMINYAVGILAENDMSIKCVRGAFREGSQVFPDSAIFDRAHVQIAIRDPAACITRVWIERT